MATHMRKANEIKLSFEQPKQQKTRSEQIANLEGLINQLFKEFRAICSAWRQAWPNQETHDLAKDRKVFVMARFTNRELNKA